jgi:CBS-domain-containing membrane protein
MKSIPVLNADQRLVGIIAREDIMRALARSAVEPGKKPDPTAST